MHDPEINPESFVLYEDDEWCSTVQFPETQPEELSADQHTDDSADEADNSVDDSVRKYFIVFIIRKKIID